MPTFVSAHMFFASDKAWFKRQARAAVYIVAINYASKHMTEVKAKFTLCDQIKFDEPVLSPGTPK